MGSAFFVPAYRRAVVTNVGVARTTLPAVVLQPHQKSDRRCCHLYLLPTSAIAAGYSDAEVGAAIKVLRHEVIYRRAAELCIPYLPPEGVAVIPFMMEVWRTDQLEYLLPAQDIAKKWTSEFKDRPRHAYLEDWKKTEDAQKSGIAARS